MSGPVRLLSANFSEATLPPRTRQLSSDSTLIAVIGKRHYILSLECDLIGNLVLPLL